MYSLNEIIHINNEAVKRAERRAAEGEYNRQCSFCENGDGGVVLHSAKLRSTGYLDGDAAKRFLAAWKRCRSIEGRNRLVESYF